MKQRSNKTTAWWTCVACLSRWECRSLGKCAPMDEPEGSELVLFGKHVGKTFQWVADNVPSYLNYVVMAAENETDCCEGLLRPARWAAIQEWREAVASPHRKREPEEDVVSDSGKPSLSSTYASWKMTDP